MRRRHGQSRGDLEPQRQGRANDRRIFDDHSRVPVAAAPDHRAIGRDVAALPAGQKIFYRVTFQSLDDAKVFSGPASGSFLTAPSTKRDVNFVFGGDVCGQGWGINPDFGGMKIYEAMRRMRPDFFIHSGDAIYADGVIPAEVKLDDGSIWKNLTTPEK